MDHLAENARYSGACTCRSLMGRNNGFFAPDSRFTPYAAEQQYFRFTKKTRW
jgi:hypothetical protein